MSTSEKRYLKPSRPPPPPLPPGWVAQWDDEYQRYFFVDTATGKSQWEPPKITHSQHPPSYEESYRQPSQRQTQQPVQQSSRSQGQQVQHGSIPQQSQRRSSGMGTAIATGAAIGGTALVARSLLGYV
ncbi:uncharacterized protein CANTADRAFT_8466 [Suhomyces tanzawaensis NRRL Y-17324]|uniref:WW domain-containing protein n=1 Tax=Suhomyces tanzawaensis NRRL Y-17324 TaxID=984487 RepID=A0A1E4SBI3_9ASCO|nr:uncharacterized protein CANTADRAFT_8466 [Suhomyces tanzawaensis NRRL Y-17324]ODV76887.1 hypothetical protein CANTADRAFT_8466 [Suhomyces tanzawaensis NRRL Y-17324]